MELPMKKYYLLSSILILSLFLLLKGCSKKEDTSWSAKGVPEPEGGAFHEKAFSDGEKKATVKDTVVLHLEATGSHDKDSGGEGFDVIPYNLHRKSRHTVCFKDRDPYETEGSHYMLVKNKSGKEVMKIMEGECKTAILKAGDYTKEIHHGQKGKSAKHDIIFIRPSTPFTDNIVSQALTDEELATDMGAISKCATSDSVAYQDLTKGQATPLIGNCKQPTVATRTFSGSCNSFSLGGKLSGFALGPYTQVILFSEHYYGGPQAGLVNDSDKPVVKCFAAHHVLNTTKKISFAVSTFEEGDPQQCKVERSGHFCICANTICTGRAGSGGTGSHVTTQWANYTDITLPKPGEVMILGGLNKSTLFTSGKLCTKAHVLKQNCTDLQLIGFDDQMHGIRYGETNLVTEWFDNKKFMGEGKRVDGNKGEYDVLDNGHTWGNTYKLLTQAGGRVAGWDGVSSSIKVMTSSTYSTQLTVQSNGCTGCNLVRADLTDLNLRGVVLDRANLTNAKLTNSVMDRGSFLGVTMDKADCQNASFVGVDFTADNISKKVSSMNEITCNKANFSKAVMDKVYLLKAKLDGANLSGASVSSAFLRGVSLTQANLEGANFSLSYLEADAAGKYTPANLTYSYMKNTKLDDAHLNQVRFDYVSWYGEHASALRATMVKTTFTNANCSEVDFADAHLQGANFTNAVLVNTNFTGAGLNKYYQDNTTSNQDLNSCSKDAGNKTNFSSTILKGADFTSAKLDGVDFSNALVSVGTGKTTIEVMDSTDGWAFLEKDYKMTKIPTPNDTSCRNICPNSGNGECGNICDIVVEDGGTCTSNHVNYAWQALVPPAEPTKCTLKKAKTAKEKQNMDDNGNVISCHSGGRRPAH